MSDLERLCDLLFEVSNEDRVQILQLLHEKPMRVTSLSKKLELSIQVASRHVSRLCEVGLTIKDVEGYFSVTPFGELILSLLHEFSFLSKHREYFTSHSLVRLPLDLLRRTGDLSESKVTINVMDLLYNIEKIIKEAEKYVWLNVDQYPVAALYSIIEALGRGVEFRIIEQEDRISGSNIVLQAPKDLEALGRVRSTPLIEQRVSDRADVILYLSEKSGVLAFPNLDGKFDYSGFTMSDKRALKWCEDLFLHYWTSAEQIVYISPTEHLRAQSTQPQIGELHRSIVIDGRDDSRVDAQMVQDAVDNYDEVILRGKFNFGASSVLISKSVEIRGEGRVSGIPSTVIYKKGWKFPSTEWDYVLKIDKEGVDVVIENIYFSDFNSMCLWGVRGKSLQIRDNRINLLTGFGRGTLFGTIGDVIMAIRVEGPIEKASFEGRTVIEGNYIDLTSACIYGGHTSRSRLEENPEYRPNNLNHEYYISFGIAANKLNGKVLIQNNIVKNANARGIASSLHDSSAEVCIKHNTVVSDIYGSYPFSSPEAGAGILAQSALGSGTPGYYVEIEENTIMLNKLNYSGIIILGPSTDREGSDKLRGGIVKNNQIQLNRGYEGIHVRKSDEFEVSSNTISGESYYGIRISGLKKTEKMDLRAINNIVENNDMNALHIREPDEYTNKHSNGRMFTSSIQHGNEPVNRLDGEEPPRANTAHVWLDAFTKGNLVKIKTGESVIDEGEENKIIT